MRYASFLPACLAGFAACGDSDPADLPAVDAVLVDTVLVDTAPVDASTPSLGFEHDWTEDALCAIAEGGACCCPDGRVELLSMAASVFDLRHLTSGARGTCGDPVKLVLPAERSAYPLMVLLPAIVDPDPACGTVCAGRGPVTTFGIALEMPLSLSDAYRPMVVAWPPWRYVYDHNSLAGDTCLGGYQEFGVRACVRPNYGGFIGFATDATTTSAGVALVDLQVGENGAVATCCPYLPTR